MNIERLKILAGIYDIIESTDDSIKNVSKEFLNHQYDIIYEKTLIKALYDAKQIS